MPILQALLQFVNDAEPKKGRRPDPAFFACVLSPTRFDSLSLVSSSVGRLFLFLLDLICSFFFCLLSRELAIQIAEQFEALGSDISLRCAVVS